MALSHFPSGRVDIWLIECDCCGAWGTEARSGEFAVANARGEGFRITETSENVIDHCAVCVAAGVAPDAPVTPMLERNRVKYSAHYKDDDRKAGAA